MRNEVASGLQGQVTDLGGQGAVSEGISAKAGCSADSELTEAASLDSQGASTEGTMLTRPAERRLFIGWAVPITRHRVSGSPQGPVSARQWALSPAPIRPPATAT